MAIELIRPIVSEWTAYTPTFTALGTPTAISMQYRRNVGSLEVRGEFTTGTVTGALQDFSLPIGLSMNTSSTSYQLLGYVTLDQAAEGTEISLLGSNGLTKILIGNYVGYSSGTYNPLIQFAAIGSSRRCSVQCTVPITGW